MTTKTKRIKLITYNPTTNQAMIIRTKNSGPVYDREINHFYRPTPASADRLTYAVNKAHDPGEGKDGAYLFVQRTGWSLIL